MPREYTQAGVDYTKIEPFKQAMQTIGKRTSNFPNRRGVYVDEEAGDAYAPLTDDLRHALIALFEMRWEGVESELTQEDWTEYQRLSLPESPEFILNNPDYYAFFTCSMFHVRCEP